MKIELNCSSTGIGDHVTTVYAACGLANAGHEVIFNTPYHQWLERVQHPNLSITKGQPGEFSVYFRYEDELVAAQEGSCRSRADWYIQNVLDYYGIPVVDPSAPESIVQVITTNTKPFVLLAPFSASEARTWDDDKWQYLAEDLLTKGLDVVAVSSKQEEGKLKVLFGYLKDIKRISGASPSMVLNLITHADKIIANDSSIAHLAALHRKEVIVVCAHIKPEFVFGVAMPYVKPISPDEIDYPCTWCCWTHNGGFRWGCVDRCDALQSIDHNKVITILQVA